MRNKTIVFSVLSTFLLVACTNSGKPKDMISVMLENSDAYTVNSDQILSIPRYSDASFKIDFDELYSFEAAKENQPCSYDEAEKTITFTNIKYSQVLSFVTSKNIYASLATNPHYDIISQNPVVIKQGQDATFKIAFKEKYYFDPTNDSEIVEFNSNTSEVTFHNVRSSEPLTFKVKEQLENVTLAIINSTSSGIVSSNVDLGSVPVGTLVQLSVTDVGKQFYAWSIGNYADDLTNPGTIISYDRNYSFTISENTTLYVNYLAKLTADEVLIAYEGCGGKTESGSSSIKNIHHTLSVRKKVNTLQGSNFFSREGYTLTNWNTKSDYSGERYGLGSRILPNSTRSLVLYAEWAKQSPVSNFEYEDLGAGIAITKYKGSETEVAIPETINGKPVIQISTNCFSNNKFLCKVICPKTLLTICDNAFVECSALETILFFDSLREISNNAINNCSHYSTLLVNAAVAPRDMEWSTPVTLADKYDELQQIQGKKIIAIHDFTSLKSYLGEAIENELPDYKFYNLSSEGITSLTLELAMVKSVVKEDDIVIYGSNFLGRASDGNNYSNWGTYQANYDLLKLIDFSSHDEGGRCSYMLDQYKTWNDIRMNSDPSSYEIKPKVTFDKYGSAISNDIEGRAENWVASANSIKLSMWPLPHTDFLVNDYADEIEARGGQMFRIHQALNKYALSEEFDEASEWQAYQEYCNDLFTFPVLDDITNHFMNGNCFSSDDCVVSRSGAVIQTQLLIDSLRLKGF